MTPLLLLALVGVYLLGIAGLVVAGSLAGEPDGETRSLEERLALVRELTTPSGRSGRALRADTRRTQGRVLESKTGLVPTNSPALRRMRSDVSNAGRVTATRSG